MAKTATSQGTPSPKVQKFLHHLILWLDGLESPKGLMGIVGAVALGAAGVTWIQPLALEQGEAQVQSLFFQIRGPQEVPRVTGAESHGAGENPVEVVILGIDDNSLEQGEFYASDPQRYGALAPIQSWPWQRRAYAQAIDQLMAAGARAVALDVLFLRPSSYGAEDDRALTQALQRHGDRVVLAAQYSTLQLPQGITDQLDQPIPPLRETPAHLGFINFAAAPNGQMLNHGEVFLETLAGQIPGAIVPQETSLPLLPSFAAATLTAAQIPIPPRRGPGLYFQGPHQTFPHVSFWKILDPQAWEEELASGQVFRNKIVLIGSTSIAHQDFHPTPFSESWRYPEIMFGVELQANAIQTLAMGRSLKPFLPHTGATVLLVFLGVLGGGLVLIPVPQVLPRMGLTALMMSVWLAAAYGVQVYGSALLPVVMPTLGIGGVGILLVGMGILKDYRRQWALEAAIAADDRLPSVAELLASRKATPAELAAQSKLVAGRLLGGRYEIVQILGMGGFSQTFTAKDTQRPGQPLCVVKQLKTAHQSPQVLALVRRSFHIEAKMLETLGEHRQIPRLLAYFEEKEEFFLVQELVNGSSLLSELLSEKQLAPRFVVALLMDLLPILSFIHEKRVIHRDLKPSNIIRSAESGRLVLIDFGIAKEVGNQVLAAQAIDPRTVAMGTQGYMPREQAAGYPTYASDLYALGIIAIQALTGLNPQQFTFNFQGELDWWDPSLEISPAFQNWISTLVRQDYNQRPESAKAALEALIQVPEFTEMSDQVQAILLKETITGSPVANLPTHGAILADLQEIFDDTAQEATFETQPWPQDWQN